MLPLKLKGKIYIVVVCSIIMQIKCPKCKYEWQYTGDKEPNENYTVWIACPRCRSNIKLERNSHESGK